MRAQYPQWLRWRLPRQKASLLTMSSYGLTVLRVLLLCAPGATNLTADQVTRLLLGPADLLDLPAIGWFVDSSLVSRCHALDLVCQAYAVLTVKCVQVVTELAAEGENASREAAQPPAAEPDPLGSPGDTCPGCAHQILPDLKCKGACAVGMVRRDAGDSPAVRLLMAVCGSADCR